MIKIIALVLLIPSVAIAAEFIPEDIVAAKQKVVDMYRSHPGYTVMDVDFVRETPMKLVGFAHIDIAGNLATLKCNAVMGDDSRYIVRCAP